MLLAIAVSLTANADCPVAGDGRQNRVTGAVAGPADDAAAIGEAGKARKPDAPEVPPAVRPKPKDCADDRGTPIVPTAGG